LFKLSSIFLHMGTSKNSNFKNSRSMFSIGYGAKFQENVGF
jgi:hypothetical protein